MCHNEATCETIHMKMCNTWTKRNWLTTSNCRPRQCNGPLNVNTGRVFLLLKNSVRDDSDLIVTSCSGGVELGGVRRGVRALSTKWKSKRSSCHVLLAGSPTSATLTGSYVLNLQAFWELESNGLSCIAAQKFWNTSLCFVAIPLNTRLHYSAVHSGSLKARLHHNAVHWSAECEAPLQRSTFWSA